MTQWEHVKPDGNRIFIRLPVELFGKIEPQLNRRWLVKGLLPTDGASVVFGHPGCGKSFLALDLSLHIASGRPWFDRPVEAGGVVYVAAEGQAGLRLRIEAWRQHHQPHSDIPFALVPTAVDLLDPTADVESLAGVLKVLSAQWLGVSLLVVDTLAATFGGGDENGADMAAYVANISRICEPLGCARMIVHHQPLSAEAKRPRGHGSLWGAADTVLHVQGDRDAPARRINVMKQKDSDPGGDILFALKQVPLGVDTDGDEVTSCIVEPADPELALPTKGKRRLSAKERIAFNQLERTIIDSGRFPPDEIPDAALNRARTGKVASVSAWRAATIAALQSPDTKPDTQRRSFERARDSLQAAQLLGIWGDWVWLS